MRAAIARRRWKSRSAAAAAIVVSVAVVGMVASGAGAAERSGRAAAAAPKWDARVVEYVRFVEQHRKLRFEHPVPVKFLADAAFVKVYQGGDAKISKRDRAHAERVAGQLRALGLIEGPLDLIQSQRDLGTTGIVGFYDDEKETLFVRGTDLTDVDVRVTLVHELTHALQDQHFDLGKLHQAVQRSGSDFALTALIEGDATTVEYDYVLSLPEAEQDAYFADEPDEPDTADSSASEIPPVLDLFMSAPYIFGARYHAFLREIGGAQRVNDAFAVPPTSEEEIIDPVAARAAHAAKHVSAPTLADDEQRHGEADDFGALSLYLMLASRLDPTLALKAAEGWGGDQYIAFTTRGSGGMECVRAAFTGDTRADTMELAEVLAQWAATLPAGAASTTRSANRVILTACDTGGATAPSEATLDAAVTLLVDRNDAARGFLSAGVPSVVARCAADSLAREATLRALLEKDDEFSDAERKQFRAATTDAIRGCVSR
jgi:hypothetical protein